MKFTQVNQYNIEVKLNKIGALLCDSSVNRLKTDLKNETGEFGALVMTGQLFREITPILNEIRKELRI